MQLDFSPGQAPVLSVSQLLRSARDLLERRFPLQWISGEVSNLRPAASGHFYFTLKDEAAQVDCVMFKGRDANNPHARRPACHLRKKSARSPILIRNRLFGQRNQLVKF